jgi:hypothetical protein
MYTKVSRHTTSRIQGVMILKHSIQCIPLSLNLDGHSVKPPKAKPKVQRKKEYPTLFPAQNNPSNLTAKIMSIFF